MGHRTRLGLIVRARGLGELTCPAASGDAIGNGYEKPCSAPLVQIVSINYRSINHVA